MSFLSRKNSQPDRRRGRGAKEERADSEYDDYGYAPDAYQDDEAWSPDEYFSPEGIKGRWAAGARPGERPGVDGRGRGRRASQDDRDGGRGYDEPGARYEDSRYDDSRYDDHDSSPQAPRGRAGAGAPGGYGEAYPSGPYQADGYGQDAPHENEDYGTGSFELTDDDADDTGARAVRGDRGGRAPRGGSRRRRADKGERTGSLRRLGRRDRDPDIWPDDGVSDEDYWASVAADRPFNSANGALDDDPQHAADSRPMGRPAADRLLSSDRPLGVDRAMGADRPMPSDPRIAGEPRVASEQRGAGEHRTGSGRLGPPPGLSPAAASAPGAPGQNGYVPASTASPSGPQGRPAQGGPGGMGDSNSGPMARPGTGPNAFRSATAPPPSRPGGARPAAGLAQPSFTPPGLPPAGPAQPSFQPNGGRHGRRPDRQERSDWAERPERPDRRGGSDWADRTERIDRVDGSDWGDRTERMDRVPAAGYPDPRMPDPRMNGRARDGRTPDRAPDGRVPDSRALDSRAPDAPGQDSRGSGMWNQDFTTGDFPSQDTGSQELNGWGAEDDPLTSKAYSRSALTDTDGRSYRVARRSRVPDDRREAALNEQTQTFSMTGGYEADPQAATARYPGRGSQQGGQNPYDNGSTGSYPYPGGQPYPARPARDQDHDRYRSARPAGYGNNGRHGRR